MCTSYTFLFILLLPIESKVYQHHTSSSPFIELVQQQQQQQKQQQQQLQQQRADFTPAPTISSTHVDCSPMIRCPKHITTPTGLQQCVLPSGIGGVCCPVTRTATAVDLRRSKQIDKITLHHAFTKARSQLVEILQNESKLTARLVKGTPSFNHFTNFHISNPDELGKIFKLSYQGLEIAMATKILKESEGYTNEQIEFDNFQTNILSSACALPPHCPSNQNRYRTIDGSCNNPLNPQLGLAQTPYSRLLPPNYSDGVWSPRLSKYQNQPLPSPRSITSKLFTDVDRPDLEHTLMLMQFGQFLAHDISRSVTNRFANGSGINCCNTDGKDEHSFDDNHFACMPIMVSADDYFYRYYGQNCINFVRSILAPRRECNLGYSQQMNRVSHFIDGSQIYGHNLETLTQLRDFKNGRLRMFRDYNRDLLPLSNSSGDCLTMEQGSACFQAGDSRCNQMISLIAVHLLFAREHNRIADILMELNPHWNDDLVFFETRRIVVGELQHIIYSQWLPEIIGYEAMQDFGLSVQSPYYSSAYDPNIDPSITNEFTTAALRFGHSIVNGKMKIYGHRRMEEIIDIPDVMFHPAKMRKREFFDEVLTSLTLESPQMADTSVADALTNYMFRAGHPFGVDLVSINIQRGRDHGIRSYNDYRELVGMKRFHHFEDFGLGVSITLKSLYSHPDDVDLYVGGLTESRTPGGTVGPTFLNIIADQFVRLKKGDKYFYDLHPDINTGSFTPEQLNQIKQSTLARIICDNSDHILLTKQAINPFRKPGLLGNELIDCNSQQIPQINLKFWQENV